MNEESYYQGKVVNLVTLSGHLYEGLLQSINCIEGFVLLTNVHYFGPKNGKSDAEMSSVKGVHRTLYCNFHEIERLSLKDMRMSEHRIWKSACSDKMKEASALLGRVVNLITLSGNRYEGLLQRVDIGECSILLGNVNFFGTKRRERNIVMNIFDYDSYEELRFDINHVTHLTLKNITNSADRIFKENSIAWKTQSEPSNTEFNLESKQQSSSNLNAEVSETLPDNSVIMQKAYSSSLYDVQEVNSLFDAPQRDPKELFSLFRPCETSEQQSDNATCENCKNESGSQCKCDSKPAISVSDNKTELKATENQLSKGKIDDSTAKTKSAGKGQKKLLDKNNPSAGKKNNENGMMYTKPPSCAQSRTQAKGFKQKNFIPKKFIPPKMRFLRRIIKETESRDNESTLVKQDQTSDTNTSIEK